MTTERNRPKPGSSSDPRLSEADARRRVDQWTGVAENYDRYRPAPPAALTALLCQLAASRRPALVVDLGSGTGLSTLLWTAHAEAVVGVEPNDDMRAQAERRRDAQGVAVASVRFVAATAQRSGLPDACADIVTVSQAFHWMEPVATLAEVARILRPGGVFAAYDYDWPQTITWETDALFHRFASALSQLADEHGRLPEPGKWPKSEHLQRMRESGHFRQVKEVTLHNVEYGDAERFAALTRAVVEPRFLNLGAAAPIIAALNAAARTALPDDTLPWYVSYRVRLGVK